MTKHLATVALVSATLSSVFFIIFLIALRPLYAPSPTCTSHIWSSHCSLNTGTILLLSGIVACAAYAWLLQNLKVQKSNFIATGACLYLITATFGSQAAVWQITLLSLVLFSCSFILGNILLNQWQATIWKKIVMTGLPLLSILGLRILA